MTESVDRFARMVSEIERRLTSVERTSSMSRRSIENGAIREYDADGNLVGQTGQQHDGTHGSTSLGGPPPPTPSAPSAASSQGTLMVRWDGLWADAGAVAPMDFTRVEVHVSLTADLTGLLFETLRATIESPRGGEVVVVGLVPETNYYVRLTARSASGGFSAPSVVVGPVQVAALTPADVGIDLTKIGGTTIFFGKDDPVAAGTEPAIGDLWLREGATTAGVIQYETLRWIGTSWQLAADQGISAALAKAITAQQVADAAAVTADIAGGVADGRAQVFAQGTPPTGLTSTMKGLWYDTSAGNKAYTWSGTGWAARALGNGSIQPQSLVARDVIVTGTVSAALLETVIVLATTIIAGDPNGTHARMTPTGFYVFRPDSNGDGQPDQVVSLGGNGSDYFGITDASSRLLAAIDQNGRGAFAGLSVTEEPTIMGRKFTSFFDRSTRWVAFGQYDISQPNIVGEYGLFEVAFTAEANHAYQILVSDIKFASSVSGGRAVFILRDGGTYGIPEIYRKDVTPPDGFFEGQDINYTWYNPAAGGRRVVLSAAAINGGSIHVAGPDVKITILDLGLILPNVAKVNTLGGTAGGSTTAPPPNPQPVRTQYTTEFASVGYKSYDGSGNQMSNAGVYQGDDGYNGNTRGLILFSDVTGSLSGATVNRVEVYLHAEHWYNNAGGTGIIGFHGHTGIPATWSGPINPDQLRVGGWARSTGKWVDLTGYAADNWRTGSYRGVVTGPGPSTGGEYFGRFADNGASAGNRPRLRITYTK
ncbi:hypothetical protein [Aeromicrobium sp.]|uniref:hypothetical protein n=1 Tax=Aeromicrobium sp. TaxID=1871063 RepID=UPI0019A60070|nr:hypothetical protein [Aeromicrobium sp.]MBC7630324.1 hypothetical protein [Aeromicrobium sp.]